MTDEEAKRWDALVAQVGLDVVAKRAARVGADAAAAELLAAVRQPDPSTEVAQLRQRLEAVELERQELLSQRRALLDRVRSEGWTWARVEAEFGVTRKGLTK